MKKWLCVLLLMVSGFAQAALVEGEGKDFTRLARLQPVPSSVMKHEKVEVIEFFSYTCAHCYELEKSGLLKPFEDNKKVDFKRVQIIWRKSDEPYVKLYAAMKQVAAEESKKDPNVLGKLHRSVFDAVARGQMDVVDPAKLRTWLKQQPGINVEHFMEIYNSFGVNTQVAEAAQQTRNYAIDGTPAIVVNGKFKLEPKSPQQLVNNLKEMIAELQSGKLK